MGREELKTKRRFHLSSVAKSWAPRSWHIAAIISCSLVLPVKRQEPQRTEVWPSCYQTSCAPRTVYQEMGKRMGKYRRREETDKPPNSDNAEYQEEDG